MNARDRYIHLCASNIKSTKKLMFTFFCYISTRFILFQDKLFLAINNYISLKLPQHTLRNYVITVTDIHYGTSVKCGFNM